MDFRTIRDRELNSRIEFDQVSSYNFGESESGDFKFKEDNFNERFFESLNQFREDERFCDISIKTIDNKIIKAHKLVIAIIPYFDHMFSSNMKEMMTNEVEIKENISHSTFKQIINFAYTGEITLNSDNVQEICIAASFLCVKSILNASINFIIKHLNHNNVLEFKSFSKYFPALESRIEEFINEEFSLVYKSDQFLQLSYDEIKKIISSNELNVDEEKTVYEAMMCWIKADEEARKEHLCSLLEQIRLPFLSSEYIVDNVTTENLIKKCLKCRDLIDEASYYHLLPHRRNLIQNHRTNKRSFTKENLIVAIGTSENKTTYFEIYETLKDQWQVHLHENRQLKLRTSITVLKNQIVFIGGYENGVRTANVEVFDLSEKKWSQIASLNKKRSALASVTLDDKIYSCGGYDGTATLRCCECYLPKSNKWIFLADMNKFRCSAAAVVYNNCIYVIGGHNGSSIFKSIERYDPVFDRWEILSPMLKERCRLGATSVDGKIYVAGGFGGQSDEHSFETYDPIMDKWTVLSPMLRARSRFSLQSMYVNGRAKVYAIGGYFQSNYTSSCEVYDVQTDKWSFIADKNSRIVHLKSLIISRSKLAPLP